MGLPRQRHLIELPVASDAADAFGNMDAMVEENEIRCVVHPRPMQRLLLVIAVSHRRKQRCILPDLTMAGHTRFGGWQASEGGTLDR